MREKILTIANHQIGIFENPAGSNNVKYNTWLYGHAVKDGDKPGATYPWCGAFVSWVFNEAGINLGTIDYRLGYTGCPYAVKNVAKWGRIVTVPMPGDVAFFDWEGDGKFDHTGIFVKDLGAGIFQAIEGNTSFKNNSNGGEVMLRSDRKYKHAIFVRPYVYEPLG